MQVSTPVIAYLRPANTTGMATPAPNPLRIPWWLANRITLSPAATGGTRSAYQPEIDAILTERFGRTVKNQLVRDFQNAWITTVDLDNLAAHGVNLVRVPFSYLTLMEEDGTANVTATEAAGNTGSACFTVTVTGLPTPWLDTDIGTTRLTGSSAYNAGSFTITGAGAGIAGSADACNFVYQTASGDCSVRVRVQSLTGTGSKVCVMIRESLAANARAAGVWVTPSGGIQFSRRTSTGGSTATLCTGVLTNETVTP